MNQPILQCTLPSSWCTIQLNDFIKISARIGWRGLKKSEYTSEGALLLAVKDILHDGKINYDVLDHLSDFRYNESPEIKIKKNDILITKDGTIGKIGFVDTIPQKTTVNSSILVVRPSKVIIPRYLYYYFKTSLFQKIVRDKIKGTAVPHLFQHDIKRFEIYISPLNEQKRIVTKIESIFSQIDACREKLDKIRVLSRQHRQSVLKHAFEGKLVPQDPNDEPAEILLKKIHGDSGELVFDDGSLPNGWIKTKLQNICTVILGQSPPSSTYNLSRNGIPFFQGKSDFGDLYPKTRMYCSDPKKIAEKDDLLLSVRAPVGSTNLSLEQCCIGRGLAAIRPLEQNMNVKWIIHFFRHVENHLENLGTGTTFKAISGKQIKELEIIIPPLNEQKRIVTKVESIFGRIDAIEKQVDDSLTRLDQLKKSVLKKAFEGKLVPQDPNDEPASVLLEKIKQEKLTNRKSNPANKFR